MKRLLLTAGIITLFSSTVAAQGTAELVYAMFQADCNSSGCHNNIDKAAGIDLEGTGATTADKIAVVRAAMYDAPSSNAYCQSKGYRLIYPGDPYRSTLFRKVHQGMDASVTRDALEGDKMPIATSLRNEEAELIRQWIMKDAPETGTAVDTNYISMYYNGMGITSQPTAPPVPATGFQVHLGPFFVGPSGEDEYFYKYRTDLPADIEVTAVAPIFGVYSHHFILNRFADKAQADGYSYGLRGASSHFDAGLVGVFQFTDTLALPGGTAFAWSDSSYLDFNSHHINYDPDKVLACNVYLNITTQNAGTATQIMQSEMVPNFAIVIFPTGTPFFFQFPYFSPGDTSTRYIWSITSHTHKFGTEFKVYKRTAGGAIGAILYDASYQDGDPYGTFIGYDYKHPPQRFFPSFLPIILSEGIFFSAEYVNTGSSIVTWGESVDDEMMLLIYYYLNSTAGVTINTDDKEPAFDVQVYPNPASHSLFIESAAGHPVKMEMLDISGKLAYSKTLNGFEREEVALPPLRSGAYALLVHDASGKVHTRKIVIQ